MKNDKTTTKSNFYIPKDMEYESEGIGGCGWSWCVNEDGIRQLHEKLVKHGFKLKLIEHEDCFEVIYENQENKINKKFNRK